MRIFKQILEIVLVLVLLSFGAYGQKGAPGPDYLSSAVTQITTGTVAEASATDVEILKIAISYGSTADCNVNATQLIFTMQNTDDADVDAANLYYTGITNSFSTGTPVGATVPNPTGDITFDFDQTGVKNETHYYWLAFDINSGATPCTNVIDAFVKASGLVISVGGGAGSCGEGSYTPTDNDPAGSKTIIGAGCWNYCTPDFPTDVYSVTRVEFGDIDNTTATISGGATPDWEDFTGQSTAVSPGSTYPITITATGLGAANNFYVNAFFDWNSDGDFLDADEQYDLGIYANADNIGVISGDIDVPAGAVIGTTTMRVINKFSAYSTSCNAAGYGQAEDYTIIICSLSPPSAPSTTGASRCGTGTVDLTASGAGAGEDYKWFDASTGGTLLQTGGSSYTTPSIATTTTYYAAIYNTTTTCAISTRTAVTATVYDVPTITGEPVDQTICASGEAYFTVDATGSGLTYQWQEYISSWIDVSNGGVYFGATTSTLGLDTIPIGMDGYKYRCIVSGTCTPDATSDGLATLTVNAGTAPTTAHAGVDQSVTSATTTLTGNPITSGSGLWTVESGTATITTPTDPFSGVTGLAAAPSVATLRWTSTNGGCSTFDEMSIIRYCPSASTDCNYEYISGIATTTFSNSTGCSNYGDYTGSIISTVAPNSTFTISVSFNVTYSVDVLYILGDWNHDGNYTLSGSKTDFANGSASTFDITVTVPAGATAGITPIRIKFGDGIDNTPCETGFTDGEVEDYSVYVGSTTENMEYYLSTVSQNSDDVSVGTYDMDIIGVNVFVNGSSNPLAVTKLTVNFNGTTVIGDIENAKIYYTGSSSSFSTGAAFGNPIAVPTTSNFDFVGYRALSAGPNYFWIACDVKSTAGPDPNVIDAECISVFIDDGPANPVPGPSAPSGSRLIIPAWNYCTVTGDAGASPSYPTLFDTLYISNVLFKDINKTTGYSGTDFYNDYTGTDNTQVQRGSSYPISISILAQENGAPYTGMGTYVTVWVDWNQDGDFSDSDELITYGDGTTEFTHLDNILIPDDAVLGTTRMRIVGSNSDNSGGNACGSNAWTEIEDYELEILPAADMVFYTITVEQNSNDVVPGLEDRDVLKIIVLTEGSLQTDTITKFTLNANGTTDIADIENARIYYTGDVNEFGTQALYGELANPTIADFEITGEQKLLGGTSYFWLTFDVVSTATIGNFVDAECPVIEINDVPAVPAPSPAPPYAGSREIIGTWAYCTPGGPGGATAYYINDVIFEDISNLTTGSSGGDNYEDYTATHSTVVTSSMTYNLKVNCVVTTTYNWNCSVWIDWNNDADFWDTGEEVAQLEVGAGNTTLSIDTDVTIPASAYPETTRMRVVLQMMVSANPCYNPAGLEAEDYEVIIQNTPLHCLNGVQDAGAPELEEGIDCGGPDCVPCHCSNGVLDAGAPELEEGIDCGGPDCQACGGGCDNAFQVTSLPYYGTDLTTCNNAIIFDEDDGCGSYYMNGKDYLFVYEPTTTSWIDIELTTLTPGYCNASAVFVMSACPSDPAVECLAMSVRQYPLVHGSPHLVMEMYADSIYYILVSNAPDPHVYNGDPCIDFDIAITEIAQPTPTTQDAYGALPMCNGTSYNENGAYTGMGNYPSEINHVSSCTEGELNNTWYIFTVSVGGDLLFTLNPLNNGEEYDWTIFNITDAPISEIFSGGAPEVSCNYAMVQSWPPPVDDETGCSATGTASWQDETGTQMNEPLAVLEGEVYLMVVSHWNNSPSGYHFDFGGTASIGDNVNPELDSITSSYLVTGDGTIEYEFSENILCSSIDASDFTITGPGGPYTVTSVTSDVCAAGGESDRFFTLTISPALSSYGLFSLNLTGDVEDLCGNLSIPASLNFDVCDTISPYIFGGSVADDADMLSTSQFYVSFSEPVLCSTVDITDFDLDTLLGCTTSAECLANSIASISTADSCYAAAKAFTTGDQITSWVLITLTNPIPEGYNNDWIIVAAPGADCMDGCNNTMVGSGANGETAAILPVELIDFNARVIENRKVKLYWNTAIEINCDKFIIERSTDGRDFEFLCNLDGNGNSNVPQYYETFDDDPFNGVSYYRLKQMDFDGKINKLGTISVVVSKPVDISVYPNPTKDKLFVDMKFAYEDNVKIAIRDVTGRYLIEEKHIIHTGDNTILLDLKKLTRGAYILSVSSDHINYQEEIIIK